MRSHLLVIPALWGQRQEGHWESLPPGSGKTTKSKADLWACGTPELLETGRGIQIAEAC